MVIRQKFEPLIPEAVPGKGFVTLVITKMGIELEFSSSNEVEHLLQIIVQKNMPTSSELTAQRGINFGPNGHWLSRLRAKLKPWAKKQKIIPVIEDGLDEYKQCFLSKLATRILSIGAVMKNQKILIVAILGILNGISFASEKSQYMGEENREIKALSQSQVNGLLSGKGLGYAKSAELNGYPGPAHVLELAKELLLSDEQHSQTQIVFNQMEASAKALGTDLVDAERALDQAFHDRTVDESSLESMVINIAEIEAQLRAVHLKAHIQQTEILDKFQVMKYMELRGYQEINNRNQHIHSHGH